MQRLPMLCGRFYNLTLAILLHSKAIQISSLAIAIPCGSEFSVGKLYSVILPFLSIFAILFAPHSENHNYLLIHSLLREVWSFG